MRLSLEASAQHGDSPVFASVGPTGEFIQPEGMLTTREMREAYDEQLTVLRDAGAEAVCIETKEYVLDEAVIAVEAAKRAGL